MEVPTGARLKTTASGAGKFRIAGKGEYLNPSLPLVAGDGPLRP
jgi:hypothetical protein